MRGNRGIFEAYIRSHVQNFASAVLEANRADLFHWVTPRSWLPVFRFLCCFTKLLTSESFSKSSAFLVWWRQLVRLAFWMKWDTAMCTALSMVQSWRNLMQLSRLTSWRSSGCTDPCPKTLSLYGKWQTRSWFSGWAWWCCMKEAAIIRSGRCSSPKSAPSPIILLGCLALSNRLRLLASACSSQVRPGISQAPSADHALCRKYSMQRKARRQVAQQWLILDH